MFFLKMAFRNIFRQKRRSFFTILTIMGCFILCSMAIGLVYGTYGKVINTFTLGHAGHIQIHAKSYLERPSLYKNIKEWSQFNSLLTENQNVLGHTPRVISSVLLSSGEKTTGGKLIGIDPESEIKTTTIHQKIASGHFLDSNLENNIVLGHALAKILGAQVGSNIIIMTQGADGSTSNDTFIVKGILNEASDAMEARHAFVHYKIAQDFLVLGNRIHEYVITLKHYQDAQEVSDSLKKSLPDFDISPWQIIEAEFFKAMSADQTGIWINLGIMIFIVSIGVLNTVLMTILERTKEFGILKAIGTKPRDIFIMVILETSILASVSIFFGVFFAVIINYKLSSVGIPYPMPIEIGGMALHFLYGEVSWFNLWVPAIVITLSSVGMSLIPAIRAAQIIPVKAIRST